jgi:hypothetical protein
MNLIESRPDVMMGKPVVAGTRITVECILDRLAADETIEGIVDEHPRLTREAVASPGRRIWARISRGRLFFQRSCGRESHQFPVETFNFTPKDRLFDPQKPEIRPAGNFFRAENLRNENVTH